MRSRILGEAGAMGARILQQHRTVAVALVFALCLIFVVGSSSYAQANTGVGDFVPRQVIVELQPTGVSIGDINATYGSTTLERFSDSSDVYLLQLPTESSVQDTVNQMTSDERLLYSEPNFVAESPEGDARHRAWGASTDAPTSQDYAFTALNQQRQWHYGGCPGHRRTARPPGSEGQLRRSQALRLRGR
jgi:hypothetical protein